MLQWINGIKLKFHSNPNQSHFSLRTYSAKDLRLLRKSLAELLEIGAISKCSYNTGEFLSPFFLASKSNGKKRFILNLKTLNNYIFAPHFKLEDSRTVNKLLFRNCYATNIDLKDAYFLLPVNSKYKKYLRFILEGQRYQFNCLPFGLNIAPYIFTKTMKQVAKYLRLKNVLLVIYLDDILIIARDRLECKINTNLTINLLTNLGFIINTEKSQLIPSQKITYLGFTYDLTRMTISLPLKKIESTKKLILKYITKLVIKIRHFSTVIGVLVAAAPAIPYCRHHIKKLERAKFKALKGRTYNDKMLISKEIIKSLNWFLHNLNYPEAIKPKIFSLEIFSDASPTGWGAFCNGRNCQGFWHELDKSKRINYLEIKAAFYGLQSFTKSKENIRVLLRIDNKTAISCINRGGSVKYRNLSNITYQLLDWCERKHISLFASYISSKENKEADRGSRQISVGTEYELNNQVFQKIVSIFGEPKIDLFATNLNTKCKRYISWLPDPQSISVDAFTLSWGKEYFYAFPPFSMISRTLDKIIQDKATGILIVPAWPSQPWYPLFITLLVNKPLIFKPNKELLISPFREPHPLHRKISLVAGKLSGQLYSEETLCGNAIPVMCASISEGTWKQYNACFHKYWKFCRSHPSYNVSKYDLNVYLEFLVSEINKGGSYATINTYRSALNFMFSPNNDDEKTIKRFVKGSYNLKAPKPKYEFTWDVKPVLNYLATLYPLDTLPLDKLTIKTITLMALTSAHRIQTLSKITIDNIVHFTEKIEIKISEKIKTSAPYKNQPILTFPYFDKPELCVASTLKHYIKVTERIRSNYTSLFLTHKKPNHPATTQTLSRWIKLALKNSGININNFTGYSVRHAAPLPQRHLNRE